jgi:hypothetical protein
MRVRVFAERTEGALAAVEMEEMVAEEMVAEEVVTGTVAGAREVETEVAVVARGMGVVVAVETEEAMGVVGVIEVAVVEGEVLAAEAETAVLQ